MSEIWNDQEVQSESEVFTDKEKQYAFHLGAHWMLSKTGKSIKEAIHAFKPFNMDQSFTTTKKELMEYLVKELGL